MAGRKELVPGLIAHRTPSGDGRQFIYSVENKLALSYSVGVDLSQSKNIGFPGGAKAKSAVVTPNDTVVLGTANILDEKMEWSLRASYSWHEIPANTPESRVNATPVKPVRANGAPATPMTPIIQSPPAVQAPAASTTSAASTPSSSKETAISTTKTLIADVTLERRQYSSRMEYHIANGRPFSVIVEIDLTGSTNVKLDNGLQKVEKSIPGKKTMLIATATPLDVSKVWSISARYSCKESSDPAERVALKAQEMGKVASELEAIRDAEIALQLPLNYYELTRLCKKNNLMFVDDDFPPSDESVGSSPQNPNTKTNISWRRASEILPAAHLVEGIIEPSDILQGALGDCWLMCALAALAEFPGQVERLLLLPDERVAQDVSDIGVYEVRLCRNGRWRSVRVDDYIPCAPGGTPTFTRNHGNELWVMIIEKAFAKLSGSYESLRGGFAYEALMDLTGCPTDTHLLEKFDPEALWQIIVENDTESNVLAASVPGEDKWTCSMGVPQGGPGLVSGHAYTLIGAHQLSSGVRLVQLRNPWGRFEWNGDWSDNSPLWTPAFQKEVNFESGDDGAFWMSLDDFRSYFNRLNICRIYCALNQRWMDFRTSSYFKYPESGTNVSTPWMYEINVAASDGIWVSLHQADDRSPLAAPYVDVVVLLLRIGDKKTLSLVAHSTGSAERDQQLYADVEPGKYLVVFVTSGCRRPRDQSKALVNGAGSLKIGSRLTAAARLAISNIFEIFDQNLDESFDKADFTLWYKTSHGIDLEPATYASMTAGCLKGFTLIDLTSYYEKLDERVLWEHFQRIGFTRNLVLEGILPFVVAVQSCTAVEVNTLPLDADAVNSAMAVWITTAGTPTDYCDGKLIIYEVERGNAGVTLGLRNRFPNNLSVTLDCSESENVFSHTGSLVATVKVPAGAAMVVHHLLPKNPDENISWTFSLTARTVQ